MKIGIITHYYQSLNYGGNLQAYALVEYLRNLGYDTEQICYDRKSKKDFSLLTIKVFFKRIYNLLSNCILENDEFKSKLISRKKALLAFNCDRIPHSKIIYYDKTIEDIPIRYDLIITGSDQVWHPSAVCDAYLLKFENKNCLKMSYAASVARDTLEIDIQDLYKESFNDFIAISVREKETVELLQPLYNKKISWVLDPVFLLSKEKWMSLCEDNNSIKDKYIFCYFFGDNTCMRKLAKQYAQLKGLKLVTLPFLNNKYCSCDEHFGDIQLYDVSPGKLLTLIKNSEVIFTDSFHVMAFSLIFEKNFYVFERSIGTSMGSRIRSLCDIFDVKNRYVNKKKFMTYEYLDGQADIDYNKECINFNTMLAQSKNYLKIAFDMAFELNKDNKIIN